MSIGSSGGILVLVTSGGSSAPWMAPVSSPVMRRDDDPRMRLPHRITPLRAVAPGGCGAHSSGVVTVLQLSCRSELGG